MTIEESYAAEAARNAAILTQKVRTLIAQATEELRAIDQGRVNGLFDPAAQRSYVERELVSYYNWLAV